MTRFRQVVPLLALATALAAPSYAQKRDDAARKPLDEAGIARLAADTGGAAQVSLHSATNAARFVRIAPGRQNQALPMAGGAAVSEAAKSDQSRAFFRSYGSIFGIRNEAAELQEMNVATDRVRGGTHITYGQRYRGLRVFGAELRSHFDASDQLTAVNGTFVPGIALDPNPARSGEEAASIAVRKVESELGRSGQLTARGAELLVFRAGLAKGVAGPNHLAWKVEVGDGSSVREFVFVDAHTGKFVDQITGTPDALFRRAYDAMGLTAPGPTYPAAPFWSEGDPFPTASVEADNMLLASKETYDFFSNAFGRDSYDGAGATMDSIFNRGDSCPNASWNGIFISFCPGLTTDDVTGHEWGHAYTEYTDNLIYQWQPGALNEAYSDIVGETVDRINGRGGDSPDTARTAGSCSTFTPLPPTVTINSPASIAGVKAAGTAAFGPAAFSLTGDVVLVDDGSATTSDGCQTPFVNAAAVAGKIALIDRGACGFVVKAKNAQINGAVGVIVANNQGGTAIVNMSGVDPTVTIPSLSVSQNNGGAIKTELLSTAVNATLTRGATGTDNSVRWLLGEDDSAPGLSGALRDMWNPTCYGNPGKVSDTQYFCGTGDNGGVHSNSGVDNRAYSLMVDGGTYNGQTVTGIGFTKASHIYFRAKTNYQGPATDFAEHADALDQSCVDLLGMNLPSLTTGTPSGEVISMADCAELAKALLAVEMRNPPVQCGFQPLLAQNPPDRCEAGTTQVNVFYDDLENPPVGWTPTHEGSTADFTPRDWVWTSSLPSGRAGSAFFGIDFPGGTCAPGGDESGVLHLDSPPIVIPAGASMPRLTFDHWISTEAGWDGGNLKISTNGGPWLQVAVADYSFNPYNAALFTALQGNTNPLEGQAAFTGSDGGSVSGSWGRSHVNLLPYAAAGDSVRLRYDIGQDGCTGTFGWYVDDVTLYACTSDTKPTLTIDDVSMLEGAKHTETDFVFTVSLSHAFAQPVSVSFETANGTAKHGSDYKKLKKGVLTIPPLSLTGSITVKVKGDKKYEADETFFVILSKPVNGTFGDGIGIGTIRNDDTKKVKKDKDDDDDDDDDVG